MMDNDKCLKETIYKLVNSIPSQTKKYFDDNYNFDKETDNIINAFADIETRYLWYKLCVYYHAKTELHARTLTDLRSQYDPTEAYIQGGTERGLSWAYARKIRQFINEAANELDIPEDIKSTFVYRPPAQHWIDEYNRLVANGEMDFINEL